MNEKLTTPIQQLKGVGPETAKKFARLGVSTVYDLLTFFPMRLEDRRQTKKIADLADGDTVCIDATVFSPVQGHISHGGRVSVYRATVADESGFLPVTFFNNKYIKNMLLQGHCYTFYGKISAASGRLEMISPEFEAVGKEKFNKTVVPVYHSTQGLSQRAVRNAVLQALKLTENLISESLPNALLSEYNLCALPFALKHIHYPKDFESAQIARRRLVFEEFFILQTALRSRKLLSKTVSPWHFPDTDVSPFLKLLPYTFTDAQEEALADILSDIRSGSPMNRLIQGDVGCGKTVIAAAAMYLAAKNGFQAAMMAPTEILAVQHYQGLCPLFEKAGIKTALLTGSVSKKEKLQIYEDLKNGDVSIVFGTHALITESLEFCALALTITDEQHRFGVRQRGLLSQKGHLPHLLAMTATPIPRSLALVMYGDMDVSSVYRLPPGRQKIDTFCVDESYRQRINAFILRQTQAGHQVYVVCPAIDADPAQDLSAVSDCAKKLSKALPDVKIGTLHGKMKPSEKDAVMEAFARNEISVLISTTVVEVGVNVPNATMMIVENAERFGLSQLHQLRGRVGRGQSKSYCILFLGSVSDESVARMKIMAENSNGLKIAEKDLELRGPGEFFGSRQHGIAPLKLASLADDLETLLQSGEAAEKILNADPLLSSEENMGLRQRIDDFFKEKKDYMTL